MKQLSLENLLEIHALLVTETGGSAALRDLGRLEAAIATQTQAVFGEELYPTLTDKAAALIRAIISDHPFVDGNERTAMLCGLTFLQLNGLRFVVQKGELEDFAVRIATEHLDIPAVACWLQARIN